MNKHLIIFLAVCLISVHAFVKRDAEAASTGNAFSEIEKQFVEIKKQVQENFKPDNVKKQFNNMVDDFNKFMSSMNPNSEAPK